MTERYAPIPSKAVPRPGDHRFCWWIDPVGLPCLLPSPKHNDRCDFHEGKQLPV